MRDNCCSRRTDNRDLKIGRRDELRRLPEVNLHNRACARELLPRVFAVVICAVAICDNTADNKPKLTTLFCLRRYLWRC